MPNPSHIAFADESYYTTGRYRSLGAVTLPSEHQKDVCQVLEQLLLESGVTEFKWHKLRGARERFAAIKLIDETIGLACSAVLRVDVLIWDTQDNRHSIAGRDDIANLQRMYYHLFRNVLLNRWPAGTTWALYPDENSALDWDTFHQYLDAAGTSLEIGGGILDPDPFHLELREEYNVVQVEEICSVMAPLCQVADLFAGLAVYSRTAYNRYVLWLPQATGQLPLGLDFHENAAEDSFTKRERERFTVLRHLDSRCKNHTLGVGLKSSRGLRTYQPSSPINFWPYLPQTPADKAPTRDCQTTASLYNLQFATGLGTTVSSPQF